MTPNLLRAQFFGQKLTEADAVKPQIEQAVQVLQGEYAQLQTLTSGVAVDPQANKSFQQALRDLKDAISDLQDVLRSRVLEGEEEPPKDKPKNEANLVKVLIGDDDKKTVDSMLTAKQIMHGFMSNSYGEVIMSFDRADLDDVEALLASKKIYYREA